MLCYKAYKFRIYPNKEQKVLLAKTFGCVRLVYNYYLNRKIKAYEIDKSTLSYRDCSKDLVPLKKEKDFLKEVDSISLQQSLRHLENSYQNFFRDKKVGFPKFKSRRNHHFSYSTICVNNNIRLEDGCLILPKVKAVKIKQHRTAPKNYLLKSATISKTPTDKYFVSILYEYEVEINKIDPVTSIGLDFSMRSLFVASEGQPVNYPRFYRQSLEKLAHEQRILSHKEKGSKGYYQQKLKVAKIHEKIVNQRKDFLHKISRQITNAYDVVCIEDLNMKGMSQALNFGKSVADNGWGMFCSFLAYKLADQGKHLVKIDKRYPSSKTCSVCGYVYQGLQLSDRKWTCSNCNSLHDRDLNASINIKVKGMEMLACST